MDSEKHDELQDLIVDFETLTENVAYAEIVKDCQIELDRLSKEVLQPSTTLERYVEIRARIWGIRFALDRRTAKIDQLKETLKSGQREKGRK